MLARVESGPGGLADAEHARRLALYGPNLPEGRRKREPWWQELGEAVTEPLQLLLIAVAVLSAVFGQLHDAIAIAAVIIAVAVTETVTEVRAAGAIEALRGMTAPVARLQREASTAEVPAASLVPGDIVAVQAGDIVPADARVLAVRGLRGLEVFYPLHDAADTAEFREKAKQYGLVMTGGMDFHDIRYHTQGVGMEVDAADIAPFLELVEVFA